MNTELAFDTDGSITIGKEKGGSITIDHETCTEIAELIRREATINHLSNMDIISKEKDYMSNIDWLAEAFEENADKIVEKLSDEILDKALMEFDLESIYEAEEGMEA